MQLTPSFRALLPHFRPVFTAPSFRLFTLILTGWALSCSPRSFIACSIAAGRGTCTNFCSPGGVAAVVAVAFVFWSGG